jgi:hypothetical protein
MNDNRVNLRKTDTESARRTWAAIDKCAANAPDWIKEKLKMNKEKNTIQKTNTNFKSFIVKAEPCMHRFVDGFTKVEISVIAEVNGKHYRIDAVKDNNDLESNFDFFWRKTGDMIKDLIKKDESF